MLLLGPCRVSPARTRCLWDGPVRASRWRGAGLSLLLPASWGGDGEWPYQAVPARSRTAARATSVGVSERAGRLQFRGVFGKLVPWWGEPGRVGQSGKAHRPSRPGSASHVWPGLVPPWSPYPASWEGVQGEGPPGTEQGWQGSQRTGQKKKLEMTA